MDLCVDQEHTVIEIVTGRMCKVGVSSLRWAHLVSFCSYHIAARVYWLRGWCLVILLLHLCTLLCSC